MFSFPLSPHPWRSVPLEDVSPHVGFSWGFFLPCLCSIPIPWKWQISPKSTFWGCSLLPHSHSGESSPESLCGFVGKSALGWVGSVRTAKFPEWSCLAHGKDEHIQPLIVFDSLGRLKYLWTPHAVIGSKDVEPQDIIRKNLSVLGEKKSSFLSKYPLKNILISCSALIQALCWLLLALWEWIIGSGCLIKEFPSTASF